jgi:Glycosyltransferase (GlcNAc)
LCQLSAVYSVSNPNNPCYRYLGAKFYSGEQYYLQIDSHSEFIHGWDEALIKMVVEAPAKKAVISAYPPGSTG